MTQRASLTRGFLGVLLLWSLWGCRTQEPAALSEGHRLALRDSVLSLFDSLSAIHTGHPDTGILRRLHPADDTLLFVEGGTVESLTGDSLYRRVLQLHRPVQAMTQRFAERRAHFIDANVAVLTAVEDVQWTDTLGTHDYHGLLTLVVHRTSGRWVIRAYRG